MINIILKPTWYGIMAEWDQVKDAKSYRVCLYDNLDKPPIAECIVDAPNRCYSFTGLGYARSAGLYFCTVFALGKDGKGIDKSYDKLSNVRGCEVLGIHSVSSRYETLLEYIEKDLDKLVEARWH